MLPHAPGLTPKPLARLVIDFSRSHADILAINNGIDITNFLCEWGLPD